MLRQKERTSLNAESQGIHGTYRFFFTSFDCNEPARVHVERDRSTGKFRHEPIEIARSQGFSARELNVIRRIIATHRALILEAWHEHCG